jgi:DNA polymerase III alpha subunit (gram-positive type)
MKFIKDLVLFDLETTGQDPDRDPIIQLSAILLDKDNLLEKDFFNSYIRVSLLDNTISQHAELLNIPFDTLRKSPKIYDTIKHFHAKFGKNHLLATHNTFNILFLRNAFRKSMIPFDYDPHVIDIWTLGYIYTLNYGLRKMPTFTTLLDQFSLKRKNRHDALEKCRLSAEIFRKIIKSV